MTDVAVAPRAEFERAIYRTGFFRNKARSVQELDLMGLLAKERGLTSRTGSSGSGSRCASPRTPRCDLCELSDLCPSAFKVGRRAKPPRAEARAGAARPKTAGTAKTPRGATGD